MTLVYGHSANAERRVLFHTHEVPPIRVVSSSVTGVVAGDSAEVRVSISSPSTDGPVQIHAELRGEVIGIYKIDPQLIPDADLGSTTYFARIDKEQVHVEFPFAAGRDCFINDDGRSRFVASFVRGRDPQGYIIDYELCEPIVRVLNGN
jgi:hypothetical protein